MLIEDTDDGGVRVDARAKVAAVDAKGSRLAALQGRVLEVLEESPGASGRRLRALVGGTAQSVDDAVALAVEDGTIRRERGPKNGWAYHLVGLEGADHEG